MSGRKSLRKALLFLLSLGITQFQSFAGEVTRSRALAVAEKVVAERFIPGYSCSGTESPGLQENLPFYVFIVQPQGFVLVSKDDHVPPVLGFSWESGFPRVESRAMDHFLPWYNNLLDQCKRYAALPEASPKAMAGWNDWENSSSAKSLKSGVILPLLKTSWNVDASYFDLFPGSYQAGGSVPIAMAQVYRYYADPPHGSGEIEYELINVSDKYKVEFKDYLFNFDRMSNNEGNPAVDTLVYCMSVACFLQPFGADLGAYQTTLPEHFSYTPDMKRVDLWEYDIVTLLHHQLAMKQPIPADWLDQAFVIDGYAGEDLFHFNMGMGGQLNGYYIIDFPVVNIGGEHNLLHFYVNYHPLYFMPVPENVLLTRMESGIQISWNLNTTDSIRNLVERYIILKDGLIPVAETNDLSILLNSQALGSGCRISILADYGASGISELSDPVVFITDETVANIPSIPLRQLINIELKYFDNVTRQPFVGELELIRDLEINFADQRGIEKLPALRNLRMNAESMTAFQTGKYLGNLYYLRFWNTGNFDFTSLSETRSLIQIYGLDFLPFDLYDFRNNSDITMLFFKSTLPSTNRLMDLYRADKYFPKVVEFYLYEYTQGMLGQPTDCYISVESWNDVVPNIRVNSALLANTKPSVFAPCYPVPARDANLTTAGRLSWTSNPGDTPDVYYNVYVGTSRSRQEIVAVFQTDKFLDYAFEPDKDYYWRVEAFHSDTTYYSGLYHFSTYERIPFPYTQNFDSYYLNAPLPQSILFWKKADNQLTGQAVANNERCRSDYYSMEVKPKSDAEVVFPPLQDPVIYSEFYMQNQSGEGVVELLQQAGIGTDPGVNARMTFYGPSLGAFAHIGTPVVLTIVPQTWNHFVVKIDQTTGQASLWINDVPVTEWSWSTQMDGTSNNGGFAGIRFANLDAPSGGSIFFDDIKVTNENLLGTGVIELAKPVIFFNPENNEISILDGDATEFSRYELYNLQGSKMESGNLAGRRSFRLNNRPDNGLYILVLVSNKGLPTTQKIAVFR